MGPQRLLVMALLGAALQLVSPQPTPPPQNATDSGKPSCRSQDGLPLTAPFGPPETMTLPLCTQYTCSCCSRAHALNLYRAIFHAMEESSGFSTKCRAALTIMTCRVCHPEVGVGLMPTVCPGTCDNFYQACKDDWFGVSHGKLVPCPESKADSLLICSQLGQMASGGREVCELSGVTVASSDDEPGCFDGSSASRHRTDICVAPKPQPNAKGRSSRSRKSKGSGLATEGVSTSALLVVLAFVVLPLAALGYQRIRAGVRSGSLSLGSVLGGRLLGQGQGGAGGGVPPPAPGQRWRHPLYRDDASNKSK